MKRKIFKLIGLPLVLILFISACTPVEDGNNNDDNDELAAYESIIESMEEEIRDLEARNHELEEALAEMESSDQMEGRYDEEDEDEEENQDLDEIFLVMALEVLEDIRDKDFDDISNYLGEEGLLFSPYGYVDKETAIVLSPDEVSNLEGDSEERHWGSYDGSGEPIVLSFDEYYDEFIYDQDFLNAEIIGNNARIGQGNTLENIHEVFDDARFVEFHFTGFDDEFEGMDWVSLRLVFTPDGDSWNLLAIVHDEWTI